jgi:hypothetical protein
MLGLGRADPGDGCPSRPCRGARARSLAPVDVDLTSSMSGRETSRVRILYGTNLTAKPQESFAYLDVEQRQRILGTYAFDGGNLVGAGPGRATCASGALLGQD